MRSLNKCWSNLKLFLAVGKPALSHDQCQNQWRNGSSKMCDFPTSSYLHSHGPWDKSKNPCLTRNHISQLSNCRGTRNHSAWGLMVPGPRWLPRWEVCDFSMSMGSCYMAWGDTCRKHRKTTTLELQDFPRNRGQCCRKRSTTRSVERTKQPTKQKVRLEKLKNQKMIGLMGILPGWWRIPLYCTTRYHECC